MKENNKISESEFEVMKAVWSKSPISSQEIIEKIAQANNWTPATVKTLINRLVKKKVLTFVKQGKIYLYSAKLSKEECVASEAKSFLDRMFNGSLMPMLAHFVESNKLNDNEVNELKKILDKKK